MRSRNKNGPLFIRSSNRRICRIFSPPRARCYIETHDEKYIGHFRLRRVEFTPESLSIEFDRPSDNLVNVTFSMAVSDFEEASQIIKIISGEVDPQ